MLISIVSVAVKVQRPDMLLTVSLDLYIVRNLLRYGMLFAKIADECRGTKHFRHHIISYEHARDTKPCNIFSWTY